MNPGKTPSVGGARLINLVVPGGGLILVGNAVSGVDAVAGRNRFVSIPLRTTATGTFV